MPREDLNSVAAASLEVVFWLSVALVIVITIGYPLFLALSWPFARPTRRLGEYEPTVTLIISAHNEEQVIEKKLRNTLELDYPEDKLEIIVASDGSTDRTDGIVESFRRRGAVLARFPRMGKTGVQNRAAKIATGEVLVFSDANALYQPDAIRMLVRNFADPQVGGVCGQLEYIADAEGAGRSERTYWSYERFLKKRESDLSSTIGANGSIYAVRRADYVELDERLISDFVEPLALVLNGKRVVYEPEAVSVEATSPQYGTEYRRKVRILTRSITGLLCMRPLMNPLRFGFFSVQLIMHKLLRFLTPVFLMSGALSLAGLAVLGDYQWLFAAAFGGTSLSVYVALGTSAVRPKVIVRLCHLVYYYLMANYALVSAWCNVLTGRQVKIWTPERLQR